MRQLEALGYRCTRAAASLGEWDVIAIGPNDTRLIQVKCNRRPGRAEMKRMVEFKCGQRVYKELWVFKDGKPREPIIEIIGTIGPVGPERNTEDDS